MIPIAVGKTARLMIGVPNDEDYVKHMGMAPPGQPIMNYEEFFRERQEARCAVGRAGAADFRVIRQVTI